MPATYDHAGLRFDYPENWAVDDVSDDADLPHVTISSPETAFWHLACHPPEVHLESLFDEALSALRAEYADMEVEPAEDQLEQQLITGYDINFICLDLTNTCWLRGLQTPTATYLMICQAEDREFDRLETVFLAMLASALRNAMP
jgi:hypothetical protein